MSERDDLERVRGARIVADGLIEGDVDGLVELSDLLKAAGTTRRRETSCFNSSSSCCLRRPKNRWPHERTNRAIAT